MKVIGSTSGGWIVEATESELAHVMGSTYWRTEDRGINGRMPHVGMEIPLHKIWTRYQKLASETGKLRAMHETMLALAELLKPSADACTDMIEGAMEEPKEQVEAPVAET